MFRMFRIVMVTSLILVAGPHAEAKDLTSRLGVGIKNNTSQDLPSLAAAYWPNADVGLTGGIGMDTRKDNSSMNINAGVRRVLFKEENMNFYFGGQLAMVNYEVAAVKESGFELNAVGGAEFFLPGLESLAFSFEGGVGVASLKNVRFRTIADHPFRAGLLFYF